MNPVIFATITKVDEARQEVTGRAAQECLDRDGEVFDYKSSKPEFEKWSAEVFQDTNGASLGNVRSMHGSTCAGKLVNIDFNDAEAAIDVTAKIVDPTEWKKITEGCYSGFSIGGRYAKKWTEVVNGKMATRYTAVPTEISIVDRPAIPTAKFYSVHKADGRILRQRVGQAVVDPTVSAIKKVHRSGAQPFGPGSLVASRPTLELMKNGKIKFIKGSGVPPQSSNGKPGGPIANTGAANNWRDQSAPGDRAKLFNSPHSASIRTTLGPATQDDDTVKALKQIHAAGPKRGL